MNILKKIFSHKKEDKPISLESVLVDMHSHLIPGVDDGSKTMIDTIELVEGLIGLGIKHIITTPHIMSDIYPNVGSKLREEGERVKEELKNRNLDVTFQAAAEYFLDDHFMDLISKNELLTFGDSYVLFELSFMQEPPNLQEAIFEMQSAGYKPILAHPERYIYYHNSFDIYENLHKQGVYLQLNLNSLTGQYSPHVKKMSERLIENQLISFLGSDCHHLGHIALSEQVLFNPHLKELISSDCLLNKTLIQ